MQGIHRWPVNSRTKASDAELFFFFDLRTNGWVNNREAGDLRHHCAHYDVITMSIDWYQLNSGWRLQSPYWHSWDDIRQWYIIQVISCIEKLLYLHWKVAIFVMQAIYTGYCKMFPASVWIIEQTILALLIGEQQYVKSLFTVISVNP